MALGSTAFPDFVSPTPSPATPITVDGQGSTEQGVMPNVTLVPYKHRVRVGPSSPSRSRISLSMVCLLCMRRCLLASLAGILMGQAALIGINRHLKSER